jgi:hypothetical protein
VGSLRSLHSESGKIIGPSSPSSSAVLTVSPFLKVLLGSGRSGVLGAWWEKSEDTAVAGLLRFVNSLLSSFLFYWAYFCCCTSISLFQTII